MLVFVLNIHVFLIIFCQNVESNIGEMEVLNTATIGWFHARLCRTVTTPSDSARSSLL